MADNAKAETPVVNQDAKQAEAVETAAPERPAVKDIEGVKYVGPHNFRSISKADLESAGVENAQHDLNWTPGSVVPAAQLNAATIDLLLKDADFQIVEK